MLDFKYILMLFMGVVVAACQSPQVVEDRLVTAFGETMFGGRGPAHDRAVESENDLRLAKWETSVAISIMEGATTENVSFVQNTLDRFAELTNLEIVMAAPGDASAQLKIYFSGEKDFMINNNQKVACFALSRSGRDSRLETAEVHVSQVEDGVWRTDCLVHELLHAFGWRGHTHRVRSAISYMHGETELTSWDVYLMRTLYDPRLEAGISKEDAMPKARVILHELLKEE